MAEQETIIFVDFSTSIWHEKIYIPVFNNCSGKTFITSHCNFTDETEFAFEQINPEAIFQKRDFLMSIKLSIFGFVHI